jgi:hypothetical protein
MDKRASANLVAMVVFFGVLLAGAGVVGANHHVEHPTMTTTVTKSAVAASTTSRRSTEVVGAGKRRAKATTTTSKTTVPATPQSTETTSVHGGRSLIERLLGDSGIVFLQIGVVLLAAFIAAAAIQRVLIGQFGGFKLGALEVGEVANASDETIQKLQTALTTVQQESSKRLAAVKADVKTMRTRLAKATKESSALDSQLSDQLSLITSRLASVEEKLGDLAQ